MVGGKRGQVNESHLLHPRLLSLGFLQNGAGGFPQSEKALTAESPFV